MKIISIFIFIILSFFLTAHDGHKEVKDLTDTEYAQEEAQLDNTSSWARSIGQFHLILLHFPIALINMVALSELLFSRKGQPIFDQAARFMLMSAAVLSPITALLGFIFSYSAPYSGPMETLLLWHMWLGILTALLTVAITFLRERNGIGALYYRCLILLFLMINITGYFGGRMTFGPMSF